MSQQAKDYPYLQRDYPLAIAHRGGAGDWPENSSQAFESAYALGFRYMETDVHLTADGKVVAFHDPTLERLGGSAQLISDLPWSAIKGLRLSDGGAVPFQANARMPLLQVAPFSERGSVPFKIVDWQQVGQAFLPVNRRSRIRPSTKRERVT